MNSTRRASFRGIGILGRLAVIALVLSCSLVREAVASTLYVAPSGSDSNPGTLAAPLATPARALAIATAGDTIYLRQGIYTITASLFVRQPNLTIASFPGEHAAVGGTTDLNGLQALFFVYTSGVTIMNLELQGGSRPYCGQDVGQDDGRALLEGDRREAV